MAFWIVAAALTLGACLAVLWPLMRHDREELPESAFDIEVYRDQLAELDRDVARGAIDAKEAELARVEISRRILKASKAEAHDGNAGATRFARALASIAVLSIPLASWSIYAATGSPDLPAQPLSARLERDPSQASIAELVARAEGHLNANPQDGRGWDVLAPIYYRLERYSDAATAYRNAMRLLGATAAREIGLGEALAAAAGGMVTADAQAAFERALVLEPGNPRARYLIATGYMQEGKTAEAAALLRAMQAETPADSPWAPVVESALAAIDPAAPGPNADDMEAASQMSAEDRTAMIEGMVAGLDQRLRDNPDDPEGWQRLVQSYLVLDRREAAADALARGVEAMGAESESAQALIAFATSRGLSATE